MFCAFHHLFGVYVCGIIWVQWEGVRHNKRPARVETEGSTMALKYKIDVLEALKNKGYTSYRIRTEKIFGERQMQQLRNGEIVSHACISKLCELLNCQPGDLLEYVPDED